MSHDVSSLKNLHLKAALANCTDVVTGLSLTRSCQKAGLYIFGHAGEGKGFISVKSSWLHFHLK